MNLVDSSGWLEYFADGKNAKFFSPAIEDTDTLIVSVVNLYEVYKKITVERTEHDALQAIGLMQQAKVVSINSTIALTASKISIDRKMPMADSLIYATALANSATVWTQDNDFRGLEKVKFIKK
ncbi:MAG: type II toxin-antitoxin system VapC family toxin [Bacteroidota bacterium]